MKLVVDPAIDTMSAGLRTMLCIGEPFMVHFWYMQMLLGIYLFIPVIAAFIKACGEQADRYVRLLIIVGIVFLLIFPTIQMMYNWTGGTSAYEMTLGGFVGRGALGLLYMLLGYAIKKNLFSVDGNVARIGLVVVSLVLLWGLSTLELSLTSTIFPATTGSSHCFCRIRVRQLDDSHAIVEPIFHTVCQCAAVPSWLCVRHLHGASIDS